MTKVKSSDFLYNWIWGLNPQLDCQVQDIKMHWSLLG